MSEIIEDDTPTAAELVDLYSSVGWAAYTESSDELAAAVGRSTYVVSARSGDQLVGMARCLSDDFSIFYLQDILVKPTHQGKGVGRKLLEACLRRFSHVRQKVLLTDDEERQHRLYTSVDYRDAASIPQAKLHTFVMFNG
jgi:ribosomal protein S18 acetylase RimI-like enzyme